MADKTIKVKVDVETDVEPSIAALKSLKKQLKETAAGSEEFAKLQQSINDMEDSIKSARTGASNFTEVLGQLPGPIGDIGNKVSGAVNTLKQFGGLKMTDLKSSFVELGKDVTDIAKGFGELTGITKVYTTLNAALSKSFVAVGIGETAAAAGAKAFAAALTATGIGAIIVGLGLLIANWDKVTDAVTGATAETKTYEEAQGAVTKELTDFNKKLIDVQNSFKAAREGTISKKDALQQYNDTLGKTIGYAGSLEQAEELMATNTPVIIQSLKLRTQAQVFYAKSAEASAKAISGEGVDPGFWESAGNYIMSGGNMAVFAGKQVETLGENYNDLNVKTNKFAKEGDKLTAEAIENDKKLKKGLAKPPDFGATTKASNDALNEIKKALEEARLTLLGEQAKELEQVRIKYDTLAAKAKKFGQDTKVLEEARQKENAAIKDKFAKQELDKAEKAAKELSDIRTKQLTDSFAREEKLLNLKSAKGEITEKEYQIELYNLRKQYAVLNQALGQEEIDSILKAKKQFNEQYKAELKTQVDNELRTLTISRNEKEIQLFDELENKKITKKQYDEQLLAIDKDYNAKEQEVRKQNQIITEVNIKDALDKGIINEKQYAELKTALAYETLQKEEEGLKTALDNREITQLEYDAKILDNRKIFADVLQQQQTSEFDAALSKNKDYIDAQIELEKYRTEQKKLSAEEERGIIATRLQSQIEALDAENARIDGDFEQDLERLAEKRELLKEQETNDLANTDLTEFQKTEIRKKYADARKGISDQEVATEKAAAQAKQEINMAYLGLFEQFGNVLGQLAGKNKALAIAGIVISQAAAIGQIIASTGIANAKAAAASPLTFGQPWVTINTVSAALSIASTIAGAVKSIQQINSAASQAGVTGGGSGGSVSSAPNIPAPRVSGAAAPEIQTTGGQNPNTQLAETLGKASAPIKAYVVSGDVSSQQALDRRTSRAATFSGG